MQAFQVTTIGSPPSLTTISTPTPQSHQVRVAIKACGLNFADLLMVKGQYQETPAAPFTLGMEVAGIIDAVGDQVSDWAVGDRVVVFGGSGGLAEFGVFDAKNCISLPDTVSFEQGAALLVAYGTSELALNHRAALQPGETLLVLGAAGGVGLTAVELGKKMGAKVIACARGSDKLVVAKNAGADHLIDSDSEDITARVKDLGGADVVYDPVGGAQFTAALKATKRHGRYLVIGFASGDIAPVPANIILVKNIAVLGFYWGGYLSTAPVPLADSLKRVLNWAGASQIHPHVGHTVPLANAAEGLELLASRRSTGKVVVTP
ncbi:NADPH:quinone oxidoreductase family protein [Algirhabdus cladophorae]|uniref:NADPH:quinone oxidoreductase family protein n=1 Tax=Algirhabdus cladophorae TaxID=3377108 RepID=UPI003B84B447